MPCSRPMRGQERRRRVSARKFPPLSLEDLSCTLGRDKVPSSFPYLRADDEAARRLYCRRRKLPAGDSGGCSGIIMLAFCNPSGICTDGYVRPEACQKILTGTDASLRVERQEKFPVRKIMGKLQNLRFPFRPTVGGGGCPLWKKGAFARIKRGMSLRREGTEMASEKENMKKK